MPKLKYVVYNSKKHNETKKCHKELQCIRWLTNEKRKGYGGRSNTDLARGLVDWMKPDPRWKGQTPVFESPHRHLDG